MDVHGNGALVRPERVREMDLEAFVRYPDLPDYDVPPLELARPGDRQVVLSDRTKDPREPIDALLEHCPSVDTILAGRSFVLGRPQPQIRMLFCAGELPDDSTRAHLPGLRGASFGTFARNVDLDWLPTTLEHLGGNCSFKDPGAVSRFPDLLTLKLADPPAHLMESISRLTNLRRLYLRSIGVDFGTAAALAALEHLEDVELHGLRAKNLRAFSGWSRLQSLSLKTHGQLDGIEALRALKKVEIDGYGLRTPCPNIAPLESLPELEHLDITYPKPPRDLERLGKLRNLTTLKLMLNGMAFQLPSADLLLPLEKLKTLELRLIVADGKVSMLGRLRGLERLLVAGVYDASEVESLRRAIPACDLEVDTRSGPKEEPRRAGILEYFPMEDGTWSVFQDLTDALGTASNHAADSSIQRAVKKEAPELLGRLEFDSEADHFCVLATAEADILALAEVVARLSATRAGGNRR